MREADHYAVLGVDARATDAEIRKAYKKKALATHPDKGGDAEKFKEVGAAYATLSDPEKRREYDGERGGGGFETGRDPFETRHTPGFDPSFGSDFFSRSSSRQPSARGSARGSAAFSMDDARAQFDRFFGNESSWANHPRPSGGKKVTQISTIKRANGRMESMTRTTSGGSESLDYFNQGHVLHGGRGHVVDVDVHGGEPLPYGGDAQRATLARDRSAIREIMQRRNEVERGRGSRAPAPLGLGLGGADPDEDLARTFARQELGPPSRGGSSRHSAPALASAPSRRSGRPIDLDEADEAFARRLAGNEANDLWRR